MFPNSCPFRKSPLQKKPLFSQEKTSVVFFLDSTVRLSMLLQILPGCGSATSVASRCEIVESQWNIWFDHGWNVNFSKIYVSYLANLFYLLQEYEFTIIINLLTLSNQSKCLSFYQDVLGYLYGNDCDPRLPTPSNPCIPAELHSSSPPGNLGNFGSWKKSKKSHVCLWIFPGIHIEPAFPTTDCHCHSHPCKGVGYFP